MSAVDAIDKPAVIGRKGPIPMWWVPTTYFTMAMGYMMLTTVTGIMFKYLGMDNAKAAEYSSLLLLAYTIKPLYAPFVEMYRTKKFFVLCTETLLGLGFVGVAVVMSLPNFMLILMPLFWLLSIVGATHDIAADGVYVTSLDQRTQSKYCGVQGVAWNLGPIVATGVLVAIASRLHTDVFGYDKMVFGPEWIKSWRIVFFIAAGIVLVMAAWHARFMPDGERAANTPNNVGEALRMLVQSFITLFQKRDIWLMLAFAFMFRMSTNFLDKIGPFFMIDPIDKGGLGLSGEQFALVYSTYGVIAILIGSVLGGMYVTKRGLKATLFPLCCAINIPNITFLLMSIYQPTDLAIISAGVVIEKLFFGIGSVGFMLYLMQQLAPGPFTTSHYAAATGVMVLGAMASGAVSGHLQQYLGYEHYFIFVMLVSIPSFLVCKFAPFHVKEDSH